MKIQVGNQDEGEYGSIEEDMRAVDEMTGIGQRGRAGKEWDVSLDKVIWGMIVVGSEIKHGWLAINRSKLHLTGLWDTWRQQMSLIHHFVPRSEHSTAHKESVYNVGQITSHVYHYTYSSLYLGMKS